MADLPGGSAPPAEPPHDYAALFGVERDRLNDLLAGLRRADWRRPSPCPGWSILGLCGHLLGDDFGLLARHRDGHYGTPPPAGATESEFVAWLDEMQAEWAGAARRLSPRLVTDLLQWTGPQIAGTFRREDPRARTASVSWAGLGPVLDGLRWAYPYRLAQAPPQPGDTVTIAVAGPVTMTWHLVAGGTGWRFGDRPGTRTVASLAMSTEDAWRLLTNNLPAGRRSDLAASGDGAITGILLRTRAIIGEPKWA